MYIEIFTFDKSNFFPSISTSPTNTKYGGNHPGDYYHHVGGKLLYLRIRTIYLSKSDDDLCFVLEVMFN